MNLGQGLGGIPSNEKNITIINDTLIYGHMDATKHANGRDWWVLMHRYYSDKFYKILVTPDTIQVFDQNIGSLITDDVGGQAAFSPDGSKYALFTDHALDLYDFDRCSGDLTNHQSLYFPDSVYRTGIAFSPNNRFLYANTQLNIFQYDLWATNIDSSVQLVAPWIPANMPFPTIFWNCQLATDGRIYIGHGMVIILHYIDHPDSLGVNCNVVQNSFLPCIEKFDCPTYPNYQLGRLIGSSCDTLTSLQEPESESFLVNVFPNPASSQFTVTYDFPTNKDGEFMLYDAYGKEVIRKKLYGTFTSLLIRTDKLGNGIYFYKVELDGGRVQMESL
ncbi:MAG: T9SS type A sorting domain-containing protein [Bacteroidetes bacterium]|nr:T9SS type A sorting domain-containing protein [Bacteroidota bacterium]